MVTIKNIVSGGKGTEGIMHPESNWLMTVLRELIGWWYEQFGATGTPTENIQALWPNLEELSSTSINTIFSMYPFCHWFRNYAHQITLNYYY